MSEETKEEENMSEETKEEEENMSEGESSETSEDGYIEQSFEVMFISDKDISQVIRKHHLKFAMLSRSSHRIGSLKRGE